MKKSIVFLSFFLLVFLGARFFLPFFSFSQESVFLPPISKKFLYVRDTNIINPRNGEAVRLRGVNMGQWFLWESYLWGLYPEEGYQRYRNIPQNELLLLLKKVLPKNFAVDDFWNEYQKNFITDWDFIFLKTLGLNMVRVPIHHFLFDDEKGITAIKRLLVMCEKHEVFCILDLHAVPGAQSSYSPSDPVAGQVDFWKQETSRAHYFSHLSLLSDLARDNFYVAGYDLLNEPEVDDEKVLRDFYKRVILFLRKRGDDHLVFLETNRVSLDFENIYLGKEFNNSVYSAHFYNTSRRAYESFLPVWRFAQEKKVPIFIGEYGNWANDFYAQYFDRFVLYVFELFEFHSAYWTYKDLIPSNAENNNNFGFFSGPKTALWTEFFEALKKEAPLREDFPFADFFLELRSERLERKNFVLDLQKVWQQPIQKLDPSIFKNRWQKYVKKNPYGQWDECDGMSFSACLEIKNLR